MWVPLRMLQSCWETLVPSVTFFHGVLDSLVLVALCRTEMTSCLGLFPSVLGANLSRQLNITLVGCSHYANLLLRPFSP